MVLSSESPVSNTLRRDSNASVNRALASSCRSGYTHAHGGSPDESWVQRVLCDYLLCGCLCHRSDARLTEDEEEFLESLRSYLDRPFEASDPDSNALLASVWRNAYPGTPVPADSDAQWTRLGFQSSNPRTDIRTGVHSLEALEYVSRRYTAEFRRMVAEASDPATEYPFAASCVSIAFSVLIFFKLNRKTAVNPSGTPSGNKLAMKQFVRLSIMDRNTFDDIVFLVTRRVHREWMSQPAGEFDIHFFAVALSVSLTALADLFNTKRIKDSSELFSSI